MQLVVLTGGIGTGKSVVARMLQTMGYHTYDSDRAAQRLMNHDPVVRQQLVEAFGADTYLANGTLNRPHLASVAFASDERRLQLNGIVHPAVKDDIRRWADALAAQGEQVCFVETALARTSGLDAVATQVWHVTAPTPLRVQRVMARSGLTPAQVEARIAAQQTEEGINPGEKTLVNDGAVALLPQVIALLQALNVM